MLVHGSKRGQHPSSPDTRVRKGVDISGKLWKLLMQFSSTRKVLEEKKYFKMAMEKFWIFVWENSKIA